MMILFETVSAIIELAAEILDPKGVVIPNSKFSSLVKPPSGQYISSFISNLSGISNTMRQYMPFMMIATNQIYQMTIAILIWTKIQFHQVAHLMIQMITVMEICIQII